MSKDRANLFRNIRHTNPESEPEQPPISPPSEPAHSDALKPQLPKLPKRGRPATGKRSNPEWVGRTYYIQRKTDLDIEGELFQLKRQGIEIDKSELVDHLLSAWAECRKSGHSKLQISAILKNHGRS